MTVFPFSYFIFPEANHCMISSICCIFCVSGAVSLDVRSHAALSAAAQCSHNAQRGPGPGIAFTVKAPNFRTLLWNKYSYYLHFYEWTPKAWFL